MFITDLLTRPTTVLRAQTMVGKARVRTVGVGVETLPVIDAEGRLVGIVTPIMDNGKLIGLVDRDDLLRTLVHDDELIASRARFLLRDYAGLRRWGVHAVAGAVTVSGAFVDRADRTVVVALMRTVPGVVSVQLRMEHPIATD
ncbi:MAG: CBS domain-containing protein [Pseudonocardiaceae bacterium]